MGDHSLQQLLNPVFRWSFSQWETYNQCPFRWKCQSILKLPRGDAGPAAARGTDLHDRVENYIKGENDLADITIGAGKLFYFVGDESHKPPLRQAVVHPRYVPILDEFKNHPNGARHTELKLAFDHEWDLLPFTDKRASCIMVLDAVRSGGAWNGLDKGKDDGIVWVGEWKSGKPKDTHGDQRKMYAMAGLKYFLAKEVRVTTFYLEDTAPPARLTAADTAFVKLTDMWSHRRDLMMRDEICAPRPGFYCKWCDYRASNGGPCKFG